METTPTFNTRVQDLPPELFNNIFDLTFTLAVEPDHPLEIDRSYKLPSILQVNAITRNRLAPEYHRKTYFQCKSESLLAKWLCSLPQGYIDVLKKVRLHVDTEPHPPYTDGEVRPATQIHWRHEDGSSYLWAHKLTDAYDRENQRKVGSVWYKSG